MHSIGSLNPSTFRQVSLDSISSPCACVSLSIHPQRQDPRLIRHRYHVLYLSIAFIEIIEFALSTSPFSFALSQQFPNQTDISFNGIHKGTETIHNTHPDCHKEHHPGVNFDVWTPPLSRLHVSGLLGTLPAFFVTRICPRLVHLVNLDPFSPLLPLSSYPFIVYK